MNTRALVTHILAAKGLDGGDRVLAKSVAGRLIHAPEKRKQREARLLLLGNRRARSSGQFNRRPIPIDSPPHSVWKGKRWLFRSAYAHL